MPTVTMSGEQIMRDFMDRWFANINMKVWMKIFSRDEFATALEEAFNDTTKLFEAFIKQIQMQDLAAGLEIKKNFQTTYDINSKALLDIYDKAHQSQIITKE